MAYGKLFAPLDLGPLRLRNRIAMMPHAVVFGGGYGTAIDRVIDYHVERAKGGAALIVMSNFLMPASWRRLADWGGALETTPLGGLDLANDASLRPHYAQLIEGVHANGACFVSQLNVSGRQLRSPGTSQFGLPLFAPSPLPCPRTGEIPKEMTRGEIAEYVATMAEAARNMQAAGGDGVELFAAQGYLLHEFLSPSTNWREDDYGGPLENRARFLVEAIRAIRQVAGKDFLIGVRMNGTDHVPGGLEIDDSVAIARRLVEEGIGYLNVSGKTALTYPGWISDIAAPEAQFAGEAKAIREAAGGLPVCVSSRIATPQVAEDVLATNGADFIGLARALISDPEWPRKAMSGQLDEIRLCSYSNQSCIVGLDRGRGVGCLHNVAVGRERQLGIGTMRPAARRKRVAVVGGGPAGMAAARVAAERGHEVTLYEQNEELGGQMRLIARVPSRRGYGEIGRWQSHMLGKRGVTVKTGIRATPEILLAAGFEAVVVATGSVPRRSGYTSLRPQARRLPGAELAHVHSPWEAFTRTAEIDRHVVVIEDDPHLAGTAAAEFLALQGRKVTLITPHLHAGADLPVHHAPALYRHLSAAGVAVIPATFVTAIESGAIACAARFGNRTFDLTPVGSVVIAMGNAAEDALVAGLEGRGPEVLAAGDSVAPRQIDHAILDGERAGWLL